MWLAVRSLTSRRQRQSVSVMTVVSYRSGIHAESEGKK